METNPQDHSLNLLERFNRWIEESITIKLASIGFLVLILLIPSSWIQGLMVERQSRADDVMKEVSDKWSGSQILSGPILVVPYKAQKKIKLSTGEVVLQDYIEKYYFLPETLDINGTVKPEILHRGLFDAAVYSSALTINANFIQPDFLSLRIPGEAVLWKDAYMMFSISDLRGINDSLGFSVGDKKKSTEPANGFSMNGNNSATESIDGQPHPGNATPVSSGIIAKLDWATADDFKGNTIINLNLKGSQRLSFQPTGKTTSVKLASTWDSPSFEGDFLPESREVSEKGFTAQWKILHYNRPFAQQWTQSDRQLMGSEFGVKLLIPVDQYQKSIRTSKYGELIIILTFVALFLVEITRKIRIHPFQYILIGVAQIIYYTLLLSFSEQVGYNAAYWIASLSTVGLISFYSKSFLKDNGLVVLLTSLLLIFYTFIFIIILQQDFSLLIGSIGLFLIVASLMYFSRKVQWYGGSRIAGQ